MKTQQEIQALKHDWSIDPCWDIEETEGFEDHKDELLAYRETMEAKWEKRHAEKEAAEMARMGLTDKAVYRQIKNLENTISKLEERIETLEYR